MELRLTKDEVEKIMTEFVVTTFNIDVSGKHIKVDYYLGEFKFEVKDRFEEDKH